MDKEIIYKPSRFSPSVVEKVVEEIVEEVVEQREPSAEVVEEVVQPSAETKNAEDKEE